MQESGPNSHLLPAVNRKGELEQTPGMLRSWLGLEAGATEAPAAENDPTKTDGANASRAPLSSGWRLYGLALLAFVGVSLLNSWLQRWIGYQAIALVYLLSVVLLALFVNRGAILFGTALTALGWNFLFAPPRYSFHIGSFYDKMMLAMYFVVALTVGQLTARLRAERRAEQEREKCSTALYHLTRELAEAADRADIIARATQQARLVFGTEAVVLFVDPGEKAGRPVAGGVSWQNSEADQRAAAWACEHNQLAGRKTQNWAEAEGLYVPLRAGNGPAGVLGIRGGTLGPLSVQQQNLLQSFAQQIALVMDRQRLREAELNTRMLAESERLGRTLLNSISHELRTPIAAITGAASSLGGSGALTAAQQNLLIEIESAAARLNRVVQSLLSAARLQSGQLRPAMDWCDIPELIRTSLQHLGEGLAGHPVDTQVAPGLPLVKADFVLMEQVLTNLLLNAALHTPFQTPIEIRARLEAGLLRLEVADRGPGLPLDQIDRIFDLFHRAPTAKPGGTGLGLAIVKGLIEAQGGTVHAGNRPGGGAIFSLYLPVTEPPEVLEETL